MPPCTVTASSLGLHPDAAIVQVHVCHRDWNALDPWEKLTYTEASCGQFEIVNEWIVFDIEMEEFADLCRSLALGGYELPSSTVTLSKVGA